MNRITEGQSITFFFRYYDYYYYYQLNLIDDIYNVKREPGRSAQLENIY